MIKKTCDNEECNGNCDVICVLNVKEDGKMRCLVQCEDCKSVLMRKGFTSDLRDVK